ncbi:MAG: glycosyltransferase family 4 protein [Ruminococcaceae bacterium]|nr:glycosyltransferase family 4 protein [Oscillospiraceae bacterium]
MKTGKVLFLTDKYLPFPSSNGTCVSKIVGSYPQKENVYVLAFSSSDAEIPGTNIHYCRYKRNPSSAFNRIFGHCQDDGAVTALFMEACQMIEDQKIDTVVCLYRPVECLLAGLKLKSKYKHLCVIGYFLDNIHEWSTSSRVKDQIFFFNQKRLLHQLYRSFDSILSLKYYQPTFEEMLRKTEKLCYVGLPSLREYSGDAQNMFSSNHINIVYAGSFYANCRRPDQILAFLAEVCAQVPEIRIHLYSWGCQELVDTAKEKMGENLVLCGRVSAEEAERAIHSADILLNVGNDMPYAVPGKLIEYFSTGKPIINFCYRPSDGAAKDCEKYENVFNVYANGDNSVDDCVKFVLNRQSLSWDTLKEKFYDSLPGYTADRILETRLKSKHV